MRVVAGTLRGRKIEAPAGRSTRPTTDRMRESIASMLLSAQGLDLDGASILDAFAGSGAMGIELISRGARHCAFCERDRKAASIVRGNCKSLGLASDAFAVVGGDVLKRAGTGLPGAPFTIVFLDPPYAMDATVVAGLVRTLWETDQLAPRALVVYERSDGSPQMELDFAEFLRTKAHGGTCIDMYRIGDGQ